MGFWGCQAAIAKNKLSLGPPVPRFGYRHPIGIGIQLARNLGAHRLRSGIFWTGIAVFGKKRGVRQLSGSTQKWDFREKKTLYTFFLYGWLEVTKKCFGRFRIFLRAVNSTVSTPQILSGSSVRHFSTTLLPFFELGWNQKYFCQAVLSEYDHLGTIFLRIRSVVTEIHITKDAS